MKLMHAVLCADLECSEVWDLRNSPQCCACGSLLFLPLSRCLNRAAAPAPLDDSALRDREDRGPHPLDGFTPNLQR